MPKNLAESGSIDPDLQILMKNIEPQDYPAGTYGSWYVKALGEYKRPVAPLMQRQGAVLSYGSTQQATRETLYAAGLNTVNDLWQSSPSGLDQVFLRNTQVNRVERAMVNFFHSLQRFPYRTMHWQIIDEGERSIRGVTPTEEKRLKTVWDPALDLLSPEQREILNLLYGLDLHISHSKPEIAARLNVAPKDVNRLERQAHRKIQIEAGPRLRYFSPVDDLTNGERFGVNFQGDVEIATRIPLRVLGPYKTALGWQWETVADMLLASDLTTLNLRPERVRQIQRDLPNIIANHE